MIECSGCGEQKPPEDFYQHNGRPHGKRCSDCVLKARRLRGDRGDEYTYSLKSKYGLTLEQYETMLAAQDGRCWICEKKATGKRGRLCVDHNHRTGIVRGLLCSNCNYLLGFLHDNARLFTRAGGYLDSPPALTVIGMHRVPGAPPQTVEEARSIMEEQ